MNTKLKCQDSEETFLTNNLLQPHGQYGRHVSFTYFRSYGRDFVRPSHRIDYITNHRLHEFKIYPSEKDSSISELYFDINIFSSSLPLINVDFNKCWIELFRLHHESTDDNSMAHTIWVISYKTPKVWDSRRIYVP